ncbi:MAG: glutathione S-transferase domain-containing protein, partial [Pseudomonadota bacterium]
YFYEMYLRFYLPHNAEHWVPELTKTAPAIVRIGAPYMLPRVMRGILNSQGLGRKPLETVLTEVETHISAVDGMLSASNWLVGEALSLADISVFSQLFCISGAEEGAEIIQAHPRVDDWMQRVNEITGHKPTA